MGRPKGSKNTPKIDKLVAEAFNMTALNRLISNAADLCADISLTYREKAQFIQLQREQAIEREKFLMGQTEQLMKTHGHEIVAEAIRENQESTNGTDTSEPGAEPQPANLASIFSTEDGDKNSNGQ